MRRDFHLWGIQKISGGIKICVIREKQPTHSNVFTLFKCNNLYEYLYTQNYQMLFYKDFQVDIQVTPYELLETLR